MRLTLGLLCFTAAVNSTVARASQDEVALLKAGERVFNTCAGCHTLGRDAENSIGPNLWGIFGSKSGSKPDFEYSSAMRNSGIVWSEQALNAFLEKPASFLPGTAMAFVGLPNEEDRKALIAFMKKRTAAD